MRSGRRSGPGGSPVARRRRPGSARGQEGRFRVPADGGGAASGRAGARPRLDEQRVNERAACRTRPLPRPDGEGDCAPIPADDEGGRQTHHTVLGVDLAVRIENDWEGETQLVGVAPDRSTLLASVDSDDGQPLLPEFTVEPLQHGHLRATLQTPARPEVQENHLPPEVRQRDLARIDRASAEVGRRGAGGIADEVEWFEERCHRRFGSHRTTLGDDEQRAREQTSVARTPRPPRSPRRPQADRRYRQGFATISRISRRSVSLYTTVVYSDTRSEEHTSELQSLAYLVCRLLLEKKKIP